MSQLTLNAVAAPSTPALNKAILFVDTTDKLVKQKDDVGAVRTLGMDALHAIVAASAAINNTETIIAGGLNNCRISANQMKVGSTFMISIFGTCTSTVANASTWRIRFGTAGTTADGILGSAANSVAANSGTAIPFRCDILFTVRTIGAAGTIAGSMTLMNTGVTGISAVTLQTVALTPTAINTTVDNWLSVTYQAAAATTTCTFQNAIISELKI